MSEGGQQTPVIDLNSNAPAGQPTYISAEHLTGLLDLRELDYYGYGNLQNETVGTKGFVLLDWQGEGTRLTNIFSPFTWTQGSNWAEIPYLERQYRVNGTLGTNDGWTAAAEASIGIGVSDTNFHYLTVVSPAQFNNARQFTLSLVSTNGTSAMYSINESIGYSHVFQFLFRGNVTLLANPTGAGSANISGLFFDNAAVAYLAPSPSTTGLPALTGATMLANGAFQFQLAFSNSQWFQDSFSNSLFAPLLTVLSSTNLTLPLTNWTVLGAPSNIAPGVFQYTTQPVASNPQCFYTIRSP